MNEETQKTSSDNFSFLQIGGAVMLTVIMGLGLLLLPALTGGKSKLTVDQIIQKIQDNSKKWLELENEQQKTEKENENLRKACQKKSKEKWGQDAECPIKKKLNF